VATINANNRIFWAVEKVAIRDNSAVNTDQTAAWNAKEFPSGAMALHLNTDYVLSGVDQVNGRWEIGRGVQNVSSTTTYNLEQVFELGQIEVYEDSERVPDVEYTIEKALDGTKMLYFMCSDSNPGVSDYGVPKIGLNDRVGTFRSDHALNIYPDTQERATGTPRSAMVASGMYLSSITYTFPVDGFCTEALTFAGNDKIWKNFNANISGLPVDIYPQTGNTYKVPASGFQVAESTQGTPSAALRVIGSGIQRRENVDLRRSILPSDIPGVAAASLVTANASTVGGSASGTVIHATGNLDNMVERIQSITLSVDLGRKDLNELGSKRPYVRVMGFPIETSCAIEVYTAEGDHVQATCEFDIGDDNTAANQTVIIRTTDGTQIDLGDSMRLQNVDFNPGDAGGDEATATYNYRGFNIFNITHDTFYPHHRVYVSASANSRFNTGAAASY
jgi:hypothetical protein